MQEKDNDIFPLQSTSTAPGLTQSCYSGGKSRTSLVRIQNQRLRVLENRNEVGRYRKDPSFSPSKSELRFLARSRVSHEEDAEESAKFFKKGTHTNEKNFSNPEFVVSDCWKATTTEEFHGVKLIDLFRENEPEEDEFDLPIKKRRLVLEDEKEKEKEKEMLSYTKEFHVLTEVQKARILTAVEDAIKKLANKDLDYGQGFQELSPSPSLRRTSFAMASERASTEKFFCKKFLLPWVITKVMEMVLCHIVQLTFLSEGSYFQKKKEFLPIVVTYYLTLFIVLASLVIHISSFSYASIRNPCYIMGVISSAILTLTTTLGILVMLISMEYYRSFREILVLVFIGILLCSLFAELCLCYVEVKNIWNRVGQTDQYYVA